MKKHKAFEVDLTQVDIPAWKLANALYERAETIDLGDFAPINIRKLKKAVGVIVRRYKKEFPDANLNTAGFLNPPK